MDYRTFPSIADTPRGAEIERGTCFVRPILDRGNFVVQYFLDLIPCTPPSTAGYVPTQTQPVGTCSHRKKLGWGGGVCVGIAPDTNPELTLRFMLRKLVPLSSYPPCAI